MHRFMISSRVAHKQCASVVHTIVPAYYRSCMLWFLQEGDSLLTPTICQLCRSLTHTYKQGGVGCKLNDGYIVRFTANW